MTLVEHVAGLWNVGHKVEYMMRRLLKAESDIIRALNKASKDGLLTRKKKIRLNHQLSNLIMGHAQALSNSDLRIDVTHPQLCLLKRLVLSSGSLPIFDLGDVYWNTPFALVHHGLAVIELIRGVKHLTLTERGHIVSHQNIPFEVLLSE